MSIPSYEDLMLSLLTFIKDGKTYSFDDVLPILAQEFGLTQEEIEEVLQKSGRPKFLNHIEWARSHLKQALLLENPRRGLFRITQRGKDELKKHPPIIDRKYLMQFPEYVNFLNKKKSDIADLNLTTSSTSRTLNSPIIDEKYFNSDHIINDEGIVLSDAKFWWFNQGGSYDIEKNGNFIFAPLFDRKGTIPSHWRSLRKVKKNDIIFHYCKGLLKAISLVTTSASQTKHPADNTDGLLIKTDYFELPDPIPLNEISKDSRFKEHPFDKNGEVNQGYLFPLTSEFVKKILASFESVNEVLKKLTNAGDMNNFPNHNFLQIKDYSVSDIIAAGCFLDSEKIKSLLQQWQILKNLILQGPPGTGKTWLAKKLAYALIGRMDDSKVRPVQFHPNLSYEDFVRGWRPIGDGKLSLVDGVFMKCIGAALNAPESTFVVVIEEINRGNPAHIFGEMLTLLEADKRNPSAALELCYPDVDGQHRPVYIPENLFVIGTMNLADRSLALVDLALRRRFMFFDLEPNLNDTWVNWVVTNCSVDLDLAKNIQSRIETLNDTIATDPRLGKKFLIGHSFVTPAFRLMPGETQLWFRQVVDTQIRPLLSEYWFDSQNDAENACKRLLNGW